MNNHAEKLTILLVLLFFGFCRAQQQAKPRFGIAPIWQADSNRVTLRLPSPFEEKSVVWLPPDTRQMLMSWVVGHRNRIWTEVSRGEKPVVPEGASNFPMMNWDQPFPASSSDRVDYRQSSLYVPQNVTDYIEYQMGRSRYIPLGTLAAASFLAHQIYSRYGYLLQKREEEKYRGIDLSSRQIRMMKVIWRLGKLLPTDWYTRYSEQYNDRETTYVLFEQDIFDLENKSLLKIRKLPDGKTQYFPAISEQQLVVKLEEEKSLLIPEEHPDRLNRILYLVELLKQ